MEDQLITFPTAKLAKEKGFDLDSQYCYNSDGEVEGAFDLTGQEYFTDEEILNAAHNGEVTYLCPTQSLLSRWLREEKGVHLRIQAVLKPHLLYQVDRVYLNSPQHNVGANITFPRHEWSGEYTTYEEAVEKGLLHSLTPLK
ncbi:hypothetical protein Q5H92_14915 [Hymenobacter sp. M29]|uniref:Uncharacterized protein n=1 Tax=Hymenobacter mellowenesis TaxID=3063995 RepID=A0ABT9ACU0_9BACT|nr:hypothetical protein [Hymenobacter sp. M29]MDO7847658.1 hypothetical protein [Hymenobacter sp. M29]